MASGSAGKVAWFVLSCIPWMSLSPFGSNSNRLLVLWPQGVSLGRRELVLWPQGVSPGKLGSSTMSSTVTFDGGRRGWATTMLRQLCKKYGHVHASHFAELEASLRARAEAEAVASLSAHG